MMWSFDESSSTLKHLSGGEAHLHTVTGVCIAPILNSNNKSVAFIINIYHAYYFILFLGK